MNVDITPNELRASVEDDGLGFDTRRPPASGGVGLVGMRERVELMNGTVVISSEPGQGTQVCFSVPLVQPPRPSDQEPGEDDMDVDDMDS
jgi:signal transduction histidine kinase